MSKTGFTTPDDYPLAGEALLHTLCACGHAAHYGAPMIPAPCRGGACSCVATRNEGTRLAHQDDE